MTQDEISFIEASDEWGELSLVTVTGRLRYANGVMFGIDNRLDVERDRRNRYEVRTLIYRYHAWHTVSGAAHDLPRIDNAHGSGLHRHIFDANGHEIGREALALDELPTLDAVVREAVALARS